VSYDRRITPARPDIAAAQLRGEVVADRFVEGTPYRVVADGTSLRFTPDANAGVETQLLFGETFVVFDRADGWCWGQLEFDGYVGYVPADALAPHPWQATHMVGVRSTHLYPAPDLKRPPLGMASISCPVRVIGEDNGFCQLESGEWIFSGHLLATTETAPDYIAHGSKLIGTPYLWGGRSGQGIDCSAFVQLSLRLAGISAPRDSDQQERQLGVPVEIDTPGDFSALMAGDLVYFPGHVGIYVDGWQFLHANAFDMQVALHRFSDVLDRAKAADAGVTSIRRIAA
jgi:cell wall-associated NlpC family hydrolase